MMDDANFLSDLDQLRSRYDILRRLGNDGPYAVYAARTRGTARHLAVKLIDDPAWRETKSNARYIWQAHTVAALDHPNLMRIHAVHHLQDGTVGIAMERRRGCTLAERIELEGPLPVRHAEHILRDIAGALGYLHNRGVVHRGVRPQSIFLDRDLGRARLAPFGIDPAPDGAAMVPLATLLLETLRYLAPEQIRGTAQVDGKALSTGSDIYSLGLAGYAMLAGGSPWAGDNTDGVIEKQKRETPRPLAELRPDAPAHLIRAIEGCLAKEPRRRSATAAEFVARLDASAEAASATAGRHRRDLTDRIVTTLTGGWSALVFPGQQRTAARSRLALAFPAAIILSAGLFLGRTALAGGGRGSALTGNGRDDVPAATLPAPATKRDVGTKTRTPPGNPTMVVISPSTDDSAEVDADLGIDREAGSRDDIQLIIPAQQGGSSKSRAPVRQSRPSRSPTVEQRLAEYTDARYAVVLLGVPVARKAAPQLLGEPIRLASRAVAGR